VAVAQALLPVPFIQACHAMACPYLEFLHFRRRCPRTTCSQVTAQTTSTGTWPTVNVVGCSKRRKGSDRAKEQATNRPQQVKPCACRSVSRLRTADSNCSREKSCNLWENVLHHGSRL